METGQPAASNAITGLLMLLVLLAAIAALTYFAFYSVPSEDAAIPPQIAKPPGNGPAATPQQQSSGG